MKTQAEYKGSSPWTHLHMQRIQSHQVLTSSRPSGELSIAIAMYICLCEDRLEDHTVIIRSYEPVNDFICFASQTLNGRDAPLGTGYFIVSL